MFGNSFLILYDDQAVCHYSITPENDSGPTFWKLMRYGLYQLPFCYGWEFTTHAMDLIDSSCCTRDQVLSRRPPAVMLDAFAIKQEWRGRGIGKHVLKQFILQGHSRMVLLAHEKKAVDLYETAVFRSLDQRVVRTSYGREYENWVMEYEVAQLIDRFIEGSVYKERLVFIASANWFAYGQLTHLLTQIVP